MSGKHILYVLRRKISFYYWLCSFYFQIFCGTIENEHFWNNVFSSFRTNGKSDFFESAYFRPEVTPNYEKHCNNDPSRIYKGIT